MSEELRKSDCGRHSKNYGTLFLFRLCVSRVYVTVLAASPPPLRTPIIQYHFNQGPGTPLFTVLSNNYSLAYYHMYIPV